MVEDCPYIIGFPIFANLSIETKILKSGLVDMLILIVTVTKVPEGMEGNPDIWTPLDE